MNALAAPFPGDVDKAQPGAPQHPAVRQVGRLAPCHEGKDVPDPPHASRIPHDLEIELILECARNRLTPEGGAAIRGIVDRRPDWDEVLRIGGNHGLLPLMFHVLKQACPQQIPPGIFNRLRACYMMNLARNMMLTEEMTRILALFERHGIDVIPYKGPLQAAALYGNLAVREICDLDFLVRQSAVLKVRDLLVGEGYRLKYPLSSTEEARRLASNHGYDCHLERADGKVMVEVHWKVLGDHSAFGLDHEFIWAGARDSSVAGHAVKSLSRELGFMLICIHNEKHNWNVLKFICDAARFLEGDPPLDWAALAALVRSLKHGRTVLLTCYLANRLLGAPLPEAVAARIGEAPYLRMRGAMLRARLFREGVFVLPRFGQWFRAYLAMEGIAPPPAGFIAKARYLPGYLWSIMLPEYQDRWRFPVMPRAFSFLYLFSRFVRFAKWNYLLDNKAPIKAPRDP